MQKITAALVKAQAELQNVTSDATNPHFRSQYASLPHMIDTVRPVLAKHGLALLQSPVSEDGRIGVRTVLIHESGEMLDGIYTVRPAKDDPQGAGGAITYCRRYALAAFLCIAQEDDDGNGASAPRREPPRQAPQQQQQRSGPRVITEPQLKRLRAIAGNLGKEARLTTEQITAEVRSVLSHFGYESSKDVTMDDYEKVVAAIESNLRGMAEG